jgi:hypothetical protein
MMIQPGTFKKRCPLGSFRKTNNIHNNKSG